MKRNIFLIVLAIVALITTSCGQYSKVTVPNDSYGIMVPADGDTTLQGSLKDFEEQKDKVVSGKDLYIPREKIKLPGKLFKVLRDKYRVYTVSRNPISRTWSTTIEHSADGTYKYVKTGDMDGVQTESKGSAGVVISYNITYYVSQPYIFLWRKRQDADLKLFGDLTIRNSLVTFTGEAIKKIDDASLSQKSSDLRKEVLTSLNDLYQKEYGITISELGIIGGIQFDNPDIQKQLDEAMKQKFAKAAVDDQLETFKKKAELIAYEKTWLAIDKERAIINYINKAAENKIQIFPLVDENSRLTIGVQR